MMHNEMLTNNVEELQDIILRNFAGYIVEYRQQKIDPQNLSLLLSEYSFALIDFWKYEECEAACKEATDILGLDLNLAGKMGKRTKW